MKNYYKEYCEQMPWYRNFNSLRSRVADKNDKYFRKDIKNFLTLRDIEYLWFRDKAYEMKRPSIDRINAKGNYELNNCRFLELSENCRLGNLGNKNKLGKYKSNVKPNAIRMRRWREKKRLEIK